MQILVIFNQQLLLIHFFTWKFFSFSEDNLKCMEFLGQMVIALKNNNKTFSKYLYLLN